MKFKRIRRFIHNLVASPDEKLILKENERINQLIEAKCFTGIKDGKNYVSGVSIPELISLIWPEHSWKYFPELGGIIAITSLQITKYPNKDKFFLGRLAVYLDDEEGLSIQVLTKDSNYYNSQKDLLQGIDAELLNKLKSLTVH
jgi:hypothetical protein